MTAQTPERIIIDGRARALYEQPLYRLLASRRMDLIDREMGYTSACHRRYVGTWEIRNGRLYLVHLNHMTPFEEPLSTGMRRRLLRAVPCADFPIEAHWFNGRLRFAIGRCMINSPHGWSHWFERERVITVRGGKVVRDREVDTGAILERCLARRPDVRAQFVEAGADPSAPINWFEDDEDDWTLDWWPSDYPRPDAATAPSPSAER